MLNKIKALFSLTPAVTKPFDKLSVSVPTGYFSPVKAEELVITALRQDAGKIMRCRQEYTSVFICHRCTTYLNGPRTCRRHLMASGRMPEVLVI